jgi:hypothetical protein
MNMAEGGSTGRECVLKETQVVFDDGVVSVPVGEIRRKRSPAASTDTDEQPEVKAVRNDDGTIEQITVRCPCGRETTIQCEYLVQGERNENESEAS